jgi:hypothetical protein
MAEKLAADARNYWTVVPEEGFVIKTKVIFRIIHTSTVFSVQTCWSNAKSIKIVHKCWSLSSIAPANGRSGRGSVAAKARI